MILTPKNWSSFQHYKDRSPPWIKLHRGLLDNVEYYRLSPDAAKALPLIWIIASERDGIIPAGAELAWRLRIADDLANDIVVELMAGGFLVEGNAKTAEQTATLAQQIAKSNGFGNRHISDATKRVVWDRDGGKCRQCGSQESIEYDHKVPVSKGGNSEAENVQLLCRPCNRRKRTREAVPAEQVATQALGSRSLETEKETEKEHKSVYSNFHDPRLGDFCQAIVSAYADANSTTLPDTSRAGLWLGQGHEPEICIPVIREIVKRRPNVPLSYFDKPISEAHAQKAPKRAVIGPEPPPDWDAALKSWKRFRRWPKGMGNDPESPACRAPPDILRKYGIEPAGKAS